jgi:hypothetical protein
MKSSKRRRVANHRASGRAVTVKPSPPPREDENRVDPDDAIAKVAIDALSSGAMSLGDLRRKFQIEPTALGRLVTKFPQIFAAFEQFGVAHVRICTSTDPVSAILAVSRKQQSTASLAPFDDNDSGPEARVAGTQPSALEDRKDELVRLLEFSRY